MGERTKMKTIAALFCLGGLACGSAASADPVSMTSPHPVARTIDRLKADVEARGLVVLARVDHAANAEKVGLKLKPMQLLIFGNPTVGTKLIEAAPMMGLSLPLKMLAWEAADGTVRLGYDRAGDLAASRGVPGDMALLPKVDETMAALAAAATKP